MPDGFISGLTDRERATIEGALTALIIELDRGRNLYPEVWAALRSQGDMLTIEQMIVLRERVRP